MEVEHGSMKMWQLSLPGGSPSCISWYKQRIKECGGSAVEPEGKVEPSRPAESNSIMNLTASGTHQQTMSSREIAQITGKEHGHVLRDCDVLNTNYEKLSLSKIGESFNIRELPNGGTIKDRYYLLTKIQTFDCAQKFITNFFNFFLIILFFKILSLLNESHNFLAFFQIFVRIRAGE